MILHGAWTSIRKGTSTKTPFVLWQGNFNYIRKGWVWMQRSQQPHQNTIISWFYFKFLHYYWQSRDLKERCNKIPRKTSPGQGFKMNSMHNELFKRCYRIKIHFTLRDNSQYLNLHPFIGNDDVSIRMKDSREDVRRLWPLGSENSLEHLMYHGPFVWKEKRIRQKTIDFDIQLCLRSVCRLKNSLVLKLIDWFDRVFHTVSAIFLSHLTAALF